MSFQIGIIGLPNVGKSTLFKALTKKQVDVSNYPFCTIDPNVGVVAVPDERLDKLFTLVKSEQKILTTIEFVDIAGLVKNAHQGEGLGNQFLSHIREVDAIIEVLRDFKDKNVTHVEGDVNPQRDKDIIHLELVMADLQRVEKRLVSLEKEAKAGDKEVIKVLEVLKVLKEILSEGKMANECKLNDKQKLSIRDLNLLTLKPVIYVMNTDEKSLKHLSTKALKHNLIYIDAKNESELAELSDQELKELNVARTGLDKLISASYKLLNLITFYTAGPKETRAWTVCGGTKAPEAAGRIHTDFEKGFIRAEVISLNEYLQAGSELAAKEKGLMRVEGKEYVVQDGDVIYFRIGN